MPVEGAYRIERTRTIVFLAMCVLIGILSSPVRPGIVLGESMAPTFHSGQVFLTSRTVGPEAVRKGDVVLLAVGDQLFLKRVYAVGGDSVWLLTTVQDGQSRREVVPAGQVPMVAASMSRDDGRAQLVRVTVPEHHVYALGDSSENSYDSRYFGPVPLEAVRGRVVVSRLFHLWGPDVEGPSVAMAQERGRKGRPAAVAGIP